VDFGLTPITPVTVEGYAYNDLNGNNVKDLNEPGVENTDIHIGQIVYTPTCYWCFQEQFSIKTDNTGHYTFDNIESGAKYKFQVYPPSPSFTVKPNTWIFGQGDFMGTTINSNTTVNFPMTGPLPTPTPTGVSACGTSGGSVYIDTAVNNCTSGATLYTGASKFTLNDTSSGTEGGSSTYSSTPSPYSVSDNSCSGNRYLTISSIPAIYNVSGVSIDGGGFSSGNLSSAYTTVPFTYSPSQRNISWCLVQGSSWFQTDTGDVRMPDLINRTFANNQASPNVNFPGIFISSSSNPVFGGFAPSSKNWQVGREYSYNDDFKTGLGGASYSFYSSRAKQLDQTVTSLSGSSVDLSTLSTGVYQTTGNVTIPAGSITGGKHIVLLVKGTATITGAILVPAGSGNLFILAAKNDITIPAAVGVAASSTAPVLAGYYTAEGSINILSSANCAASSPDLRLNVGGAFIANSLYPFQTGQSGQVKNQRNLCGDNTLYPSLSFTTRADFLTQMTDFYKTTYKTFREVEP
jgi:hypothetical protein